MRIAWLTDLHLNFLDPAGVDALCSTIAAGAPDAVLLTGDISEAGPLERHLRMLEAHLLRPIYFVLGNHDFYRGSIAGVRAGIRDLCAASSHLKWLSDTGVIPLSDHAGLVGHDGWADGRAGDYDGSEVFLNDYRLIAELTHPDAGVRLARMQALASEAAEHLRTTVASALAKHAHVLVATHVPPFREACWHEGQISSDDWLPHFTCVAVGEVLVELMGRNPARRMTVLCGHTHSAGRADVLPNLVVHTGAAQYGRPHVQSFLEV